MAEWSTPLELSPADVQNLTMENGSLPFTVYIHDFVKLLPADSSDLHKFEQVVQKTTSLCAMLNITLVRGDMPDNKQGVMDGYSLKVHIPLWTFAKCVFERLDRSPALAGSLVEYTMQLFFFCLYVAILLQFPPPRRATNDDIQALSNTVFKDMTAENCSFIADKFVATYMAV